MEKYQQLRKQAEEMMDKAEKENRVMTEDEQTKFDDLVTQAKAEKEQYERKQQLVKLDDWQRESAGRISKPQPPQIELPDQKRYSILRALDCISAGRELDGLEGEISQEISLKSGKNPQGFFMPLSLPMGSPRKSSHEKYDLDTTAGTGAVGTFTDPSNFIDMLRNNMLVVRLGARMLGGLVGNLSLPKQTGGATAYWVDESDPVTESAQTIGAVPLSPKTLGAYTDISRKFMVQSSLDAEQFVRQDLAVTLALAYDKAALNGSGSGAEPEGILQNSGISNAGAVSVDYDGIVNLESTIADDNADINRLAYVTSAKGRGLYKKKDEGTDTGFRVWGKDNHMNGYPAYATNQIPKTFSIGSYSDYTAVIFGNWDDLVLASWTGVDVTVDTATGSATGAKRIVMLHDCDIVVRRDESFATHFIR